MLFPYFSRDVVSRHFIELNWCPPVGLQDFRIAGDHLGLDSPLTHRRALRVGGDGPM